MVAEMEVEAAAAVDTVATTAEATAAEKEVDNVAAVEEAVAIEVAAQRAMVATTARVAPSAVAIVHVCAAVA